MKIKYIKKKVKFKENNQIEIHEKYTPLKNKIAKCSIEDRPGPGIMFSVHCGAIS